MNAYYDDYKAEARAVLQDFLTGYDSRDLFALENNTGDASLGFLIKGLGLKVFKRNMFTLETGPLFPQLADTPTETYDSIDALFAAGWEVD